MGSCCCLVFWLFPRGVIRCNSLFAITIHVPYHQFIGACIVGTDCRILTILGEYAQKKIMAIIHVQVVDLKRAACTPSNKCQSQAISSEEVIHAGEVYFQMSAGMTQSHDRFPAQRLISDQNISCQTVRKRGIQWRRDRL